MMIYLQLTLLALVAIVPGHANMSEDVDEAKMQEMYNCFFAILCKARKPEEFRRVMTKASEDLIKRGFRWLKEISNIDAEDTPEFWASYPDYKCHLSEETKQEYFMEWMKRLGEYWAEACAEQDSERCMKMAACENEYNIVTAEYTANGICSAQAKELGEKKLQEGKGSMEDGLSNAKSMPGFG